MEFKSSRLRFWGLIGVGLAIAAIIIGLVISAGGRNDREAQSPPLDPPVVSDQRSVNCNREATIPTTFALAGFSSGSFQNRGTTMIAGARAETDLLEQNSNHRLLVQSLGRDEIVVNDFVDYFYGDSLVNRQDLNQFSQPGAEFDWTDSAVGVEIAWDGPEVVFLVTNLADGSCLAGRVGPDPTATADQLIMSERQHLIRTLDRFIRHVRGSLSN